MITPDPRHLSHGLEIPTESYSDQPFIVQTDDGARELRIAPEVSRLNLYGQILRTFEAVTRHQRRGTLPAGAERT
jgi:hypothetical protein